MYTKFLRVLSVVLVGLTLLCSCTKGEEQAPETNSGEPNAQTKETISQTTPTTAESTPESTSAPALSGYVDAERIQKDLVAVGGNCFYIDNREMYLPISSVEILRRKSNEEQDEVYISATFSDTYYTVKATCVLYYNYYTVGGWNLDEYEVKAYQSAAIANATSDSDIVAYFQNHFSSFEISSRSQMTDQDGNYIDTVNFTATKKYPYLTVNFSGWYIQRFYDDYWHESYNFWADSYDWSEFVGDFRYRDQTINLGAGSYSADVKMTFSNVQQISDKELSVTYDASVYLYDKTGRYVEEDEKITQKTKTLSISWITDTILGIDFDVPEKAQYIFLPWYGTFAVFLNKDTGVEATDNTDYGKSFAHLGKVVSDEDLQDAIDKLKEMNP